LKLKRIYIYIVIIAILTGCKEQEKIEKKSKTPIIQTEVLDDFYLNSEVSKSKLSQKQKDVETEHNIKRRNHFLDSDITYSIKLEKAAQSYANILAKSGKFEHDPKNREHRFGENLYAHTQDETPTILDAIPFWYDDERPYYHYDNGSCDEGLFSNGQDIMCGHYTQIIWQDTKEVGCASAQYSSGDFKDGHVYVCKYQKAGNIIGLKPYCTEYSTDDLYSKRVPSFKNIPLSNRIFPIELVVEDREKCTRKDNHNSAISFGAEMKSIVIKDFQIFNNGRYPNTLEFSSIIIGEKEIKMRGINKNIADTNLRNKKIYMNIKLIGETRDYYAVELDWNGYDANQTSFSRQMKAKLYK